MPRKSQEDQDGLIFETEDYYLYAADLIKRYFEDKSYFIGGPIPQSKLFSLSSIQIVLHTQLDVGVHYIHENLMSKIKAPADYDDSGMPWEIHKMIQMLYGMSQYEIPKRFRGGLLLLYFKFCKGCSIPSLEEIDPDFLEINSNIEL